MGLSLTASLPPPLRRSWRLGKTAIWTVRRDMDNLIEANEAFAAAVCRSSSARRCTSIREKLNQRGAIALAGHPVGASLVCAYPRHPAVVRYEDGWRTHKGLATLWHIGGGIGWLVRYHR